MDKSYSKYNLGVDINAVLIHSDVLVYWDGEGFQAVADKGSYDGLNTNNMVGTYSAWSTTNDILSDTDFFIKEFNAKAWPENTGRMDVIGQNGNTGESYGKISGGAANDE